jgi:hypothetical protein
MKCNAEIYINKVTFHTTSDRDINETEITDLAEVYDNSSTMRLYFDADVSDTDTLCYCGSVSSGTYLEYKNPRSIFEGVIPKAGDTFIIDYTNSHRIAKLIDGETRLPVYEKFIDVSRQFPRTAIAAEERERCRRIAEIALARIKKNSRFGAKCEYLEDGTRITKQ